MSEWKRVTMYAHGNKEDAWEKGEMTDRSHQMLTDIRKALKLPYNAPLSDILCAIKRMEEVRDSALKASQMAYEQMQKAGAK